MNKKGFLDLGLLILMGWGSIIGAIVIHSATAEKTLQEKCINQDVVQIGNSLYKCNRTHTLGEEKVIIQKVIEKKYIKQPCPKPKENDKDFNKWPWPMCKARE